MIRQAYCTLEALEEMEAFQDEAEYTTLNQVLTTHHHICVHLPEDDLDEQLRQSKCLLYYEKRSQRNKAYKLSATPQPYQEVLQSTGSTDLAGTVFVVDDAPTECAEWSRNYGVCVVSRHAPETAAYLTKELARKEIKVSKKYLTSPGSSQRNGWDSVLTPRSAQWQKAPLNALVIVDNYLLGKKGDKLALGQENLISLLDALLPATLAMDFHLLLVTNNGDAHLKSKNLTELAKQLRHALGRPYELKIGVVTRKNGPEHRRAIISNYYFGASHHGFSCFDGPKAKWANDLIVSGIFSGVAEPGYHVPWISMHDELRAVRIRRDKNLKLRNPTTSYDDPIHLAFGFCNNRLLDLVPA